MSSGFLCDENIPIRTYRVLRDIKETKNILHVKEDIGKFGVSDEEILKISRESSRTLITNDLNDFSKECHTHIKKGPGVWIVYSPKSEEQVTMIRSTVRIPELATAKGRRSKIVKIMKEKTTWIDTVTQATVTLAT